MSARLRASSRSPCECLCPIARTEAARTDRRRAAFRERDDGARPFDEAGVDDAAERTPWAVKVKRAPLAARFTPAEARAFCQCVASRRAPRLRRAREAASPASGRYPRDAGYRVRLSRECPEVRPRPTRSR